MTVSPKLLNRVQADFHKAFGGAPAAIAQAPGRVNLIGEHTDYNDGFVLPCAIDRHTLAAVRPRDDDRIVCVAADLHGKTDEFCVDGPFGPDADPSRNYVRGMMKGMLGERRGLRGFDLLIAGDVPQGAGLSSSASLEVATGTVIAAVQRLDIGAKEIARFAQRAENEFVGCACGIMDQLISACAQSGAALLIDCRSLDCTAIAMPAELSLMIVHSGIDRGLVDSHYNERRRQCEQAAAHYGVAALRDLTPQELAARRAGLGELPYRRARHVVSENARVEDMVAALARRDLRDVNRLMRASHRSMRDDFQITVPAIDDLVAIIDAELGGIGGTRMTGGGFGGCVVALLPATRAESIKATVRATYRRPDGKEAEIFDCRLAGGAGLLPAGQ